MGKKRKVDQDEEKGIYDKAHRSVKRLSRNMEEFDDLTYDFFWG